MTVRIGSAETAIVRIQSGQRRHLEGLVGRSSINYVFLLCSFDVSALPAAVVGCIITPGVGNIK